MTCLCCLSVLGLKIRNSIIRFSENYGNDFCLKTKCGLISIVAGMAQIGPNGSQIVFALDGIDILNDADRERGANTLASTIMITKNREAM